MVIFITENKIIFAKTAQAVCRKQHQKKITDYQKELVAKLLLERISLRGICRVMNVTMVLLLDFFREITNEIPKDMGIIIPDKGRLTIELDEMWSFVGSKENKQWIWRQ